MERSNQDGAPTQVIGIKGIENVDDLISKFDFGLCQIAYDGEQITYTNAFIKDFMNRTMTLTHANKYDRSIERYKEWTKKKYKGWKFVPSGIVLREMFIRSHTLKSPNDILAYEI